MADKNLLQTFHRGADTECISNRLDASHTSVAGVIESNPVARDVKGVHRGADTEHFGEELCAFRSEVVIRNTKYKNQM